MMAVILEIMQKFGNYARKTIGKEKKMNSNCDYDHDALCSKYTSGESFISKLNPSKLPTKVYIIIIYEQMK